jgi:hypothetical protein
MIESPTSSQRYHHILVEPCSGGIENCDDAFSAMLIAYLMNEILHSPQVNLISGIVYLCVVDCLFADIHAHDLNSLNFVLYGDTDCADTAPQIQHNLALLDPVDDVLVKDLAHVDVGLEEG